MKRTWVPNAALVAVIVVSLALPGWAKSPKMKMSTKVPPGIEMPDKVETRLGTLKFFDGFPDDATVDKLYDNLDFQRAVQAYLLGLAPVNQVANRKGILEVGPANTTVPIFETMMNARSIFLTPNNNTPYTWFWLDLRKGPLVLEVPPKVLGLIDDMWYHFVTDVGMVGPDKGAGGKYLLLPPGYKGEVPKGYFVVRLATFSVWIAWRTFLENGDPKPGVDRVKKFTKIYPVSQAANPPKLKFVNVSSRDFNMGREYSITALREGGEPLPDTETTSTCAFSPPDGAVNPSPAWGNLYYVGAGFIPARTSPAPRKGSRIGPPE